MSNPQFSPLGTTLVLPTSTVSAEGQMGGGQHAAQVVRIYNAGDDVAFFKFSGNSGQTATPTDNFIAPGQTELFSVPIEVTFISARTASGTGKLYVVKGDGE